MTAGASGATEGRASFGMHPSHRLLVAAALLAPVAAGHAQAAKRGITAEDYFSFELVSDPRISPDGSRVVYVVSRVDRAQNKRVPSIWIAPTDGSAPAQRDRRRIVVAERAALVARRREHRVHLVARRRHRRRGARATDAAARSCGSSRPAAERRRRVTSIMNGVSNCTIAPKGKLAACLSRTGPSDKWPAGKERSDVRHYTQSSYKFNDNGWYDDKRSHIWIVDLATGDAKQITFGDAWNDTDPQWSPNGARLAFVSDRTGKEFDGGRNTDVWTIPASGCPAAGDACITKVSSAPGRTISRAGRPTANSIAFITRRGRGSAAATRDRAGVGWRRDRAGAEPRPHSDRPAVGERRRALLRHAA